MRSRRTEIGGGEAGAEGCEVQEGRAQGQVGRGSERER